MFVTSIPALHFWFRTGWHWTKWVVNPIFTKVSTWPPVSNEKLKELLKTLTPPKGTTLTTADFSNILIYSSSYSQSLDTLRLSAASSHYLKSTLFSRLSCLRCMEISTKVGKSIFFLLCSNPYYPPNSKRLRSLVHSFAPTLLYPGWWRHIPAVVPVKAISRVSLLNVSTV